TENTTFSVCHKINKDYHDNIPIGVPISNSTAYVMDCNQNLLPIGIPGELYVGGDGVSLGYVNDPELTARKFVDDPFVSGGRLYRTGDLVRWTSEGLIEFMGRVDEQVKIRGFRIELGEIKNALLTNSQITDCTVLAKEINGNKSLLAYYTGEEADRDEIRSFLLNVLPDYMVPSHYVHMESLPLTVNGKVDRKALPAPVLTSTEGYVAPSTSEEKLLAAIWSEVLGIDTPGVNDNFFALGGDSIKSIQISSRLRSSGYVLTISDILSSPTISGLTSKLSPLVETTDQGVVTGEVAVTPIQEWFFSNTTEDQHHFNQSYHLTFATGIDASWVTQIFGKLQEHHDALRMVFTNGDGSVVQYNKGLDLELSLTEYDLKGEKDSEAIMYAYAQELQESINLVNGPLMKLGLFHDGAKSHLLIVIHHLVVDGVSWRILFEDIETLYQQLVNGDELKLPLKTDSYKSWSDGLATYQQSISHTAGLDYWNIFEAQPYDELPSDYPDAPRGGAVHSQVSSFTLDTNFTRDLLTKVHGRFNTHVNDILLTALMLSVYEQYGLEHLRIDLEGHGREPLADNLDISRTVGWFTSIYPVRLSKEGADLSAMIKETKERLHRIPNQGVDYLLSQYWGSGDQHATANISFNYLGQYDSDTAGKAYDVDAETLGEEVSFRIEELYDWNISGRVVDGKLEMNLRYGSMQYKSETVDKFMEHYRANLEEVIRYCLSEAKTEFTPWDLTYKALSIAELDKLQSAYAIEDIYPLSPMQEGMLFHSLYDQDSDHYFVQLGCHWSGTMNLQAIEKSLASLTDRYDIFRTVFLHEDYARPLQMVLTQRATSFNYVDVREECAQESRESVIERYRLADRSHKFDLGEDVLMRLTVLQSSDSGYDFIWSFHHILMDGWCMSIIFSDFLKFYAQHSGLGNAALPEVQPYSNYIEWLEAGDSALSKSYWETYLADYSSLASLPKNTLSGSAQGYDQAIHELVLDKSLTSSLLEISQAEGVTLNTIIQTVWGTLLSRYNNTNDVVFGSVVSGRPAELPGVEDMVGLFINTVPVRVRYEGSETLSDVMSKLQQSASEGEAYHYHPLQKIQGVSELGRDLLDHLLIFENYPISEEIKSGSGADYQIEEISFHEQTNYDFTLMILPGEELSLKMSYNSQVYDAATITAISNHLEGLIAALVKDISAPLSSLSVITEGEEATLEAFNATDKFYAPEESTIVSVFADQVRQHGDRPALYYQDEELSYAELDRISNQIANYLMAQGVNTGSLVGLMMERDLHLLPCIYGILKAGGVYVPIDPNFPAERKRAIAVDSAMPLVITTDQCDKEGLETLEVLDLADILFSLQDISSSHPAATIKGHDLAYVIYTSGSTGTPKGVIIEHRSVVNRLFWMQDAYPIGGSDVLLQKTPLVFDVSIWELFWWSFTGASLALLPPKAEKDPEAIIAAIERYGVSTIHFVPSMLEAFQMMLGEGFDYTRLQSLRQVFASGEALKAIHSR
ncbi:MAG: condensation domain-containing protein, partial [Bacteroidota bacterium]